MLYKFYAFILIGAIGTIAHYSILYCLVEYYAVSPVWGSGWGALAGLFINYFLNYSSRLIQLSTGLFYNLSPTSDFLIDVIR